MRRLPIIVFLLVIGGLLAMAGPQAPAEVPEADRPLVEGVFQRLLAVSEPPKGVAWPPVLEIIEEDKVNAYATLKDGPAGQVPHVVVYRGMLTRVVEGKPDRLAFIMGHEIGHVVLGHCKGEGAGNTTFLETMHTRTQELEADTFGMKLALSAGFDYQGGLSSIRKMIDTGLEYSSFEGLSSDHPSWKERMVYLDPKQSQIWKSMSAFENGAVFLLVEQYPPAAGCFYEVTTQFPECPEGWSNLGYALLMQYCDGLDAKDLKNLKVGQIVCGGFYRRSASLQGMLRGGDEDLWLEAVEALEKALQLNPKLTLARANLGIAYLVDPRGPKLDKASRYLIEAAMEAEKDESLDPLARAAVLVNAGVAELAGGQVNQAVSRLDAAEALGRSFAARRPGIPPSEALAMALLYNRAMVLAGSSAGEERAQALALLEEYLSKTNRSSAWWQLAHESYVDLCKAQNRAPRDLSARGSATAYRPVTSVQVDGRLITLADPVDKLRKLGDVPAVPVPGGGGLTQLSYPHHGVDLLATDKLVGIRLKGPSAPALSLKEAGLGGQGAALKVGMSKQDLEQTLANQDYDFRQLDNPEVNYRFYRHLGLAVLVRQGAVQELMVVQLPSDPTL
ncbi:MAG: M48 family metalloprotease [Candidatus Eremiobacterota bacterium]